MMDGLRALVARMLRGAARRLEAEPAGSINRSPKPYKPSEWSVRAPGFPGNREMPPARKLGPYEAALSAPDILTYIDKESFDRLAERVRQERGEKDKE
jgi:hypothetical protein